MPAEIPAAGIGELFALAACLAIRLQHVPEDGRAACRVRALTQSAAQTAAAATAAE